MSDDVIFVVEVMNEDVVDHRIQERSIRARADSGEYIRRGGGSRKSRIYMDDDCAIVLCLANPLEGHRMVFSYIAAFDQNALAMLHVGPMIRHRAPSECRPQTGDRGAVSKTGLMFDE